MSDFEAALASRLARNAELAAEREETERAVAEAEQRATQEAAAAAEARRIESEERHAELVDALRASAEHLKAADPAGFVVRLGWTETHQEFLAKVSTRLVEPARSLLIELDRDDDEVLVRWNSDVGNALELWRLLEVEPALIQELILQIADQEHWARASGPPPFPS